MGLVRTLSVQGGLASLVLGDLVHLVLLALLALAEGPLRLWYIHLEEMWQNRESALGAYSMVRRAARHLQNGNGL